MRNTASLGLIKTERVSKRKSVCKGEGGERNKRNWVGGENKKEKKRGRKKLV